MPRHRGKFDLNKKEPYELSRSKIENFIQCPACFFMQQVEGIKFPTIPGFNINEATDILLKKDFDRYRGAPKTHPFLRKMGYEHLIPFKHKYFNLWTQSLHFGAENRLNYDHKPSNIRVGGGLDDVWFNINTKKLHVVDYKSTSQKKDLGPITLDDKWKSTYKRQMDLYTWILLNKGFDVDYVGFFLYCDGDRFNDKGFLGENIAKMEFKITLIPYKVNMEWIDQTLNEIHETLRKKIRPKHSEFCEFGNFLKNSNYFKIET